MQAQNITQTCSYEFFKDFLWSYCHIEQRKIIKKNKQPSMHTLLLLVVVVVVVLSIYGDVAKSTVQQ